MLCPLRIIRSLLLPATYSPPRGTAVCQVPGVWPALLEHANILVRIKVLGRGLRLCNKVVFSR